MRKQGVSYFYVVLCYAHKSVSRRYITIENLRESQINGLIVYMNREIVQATKPLPCSMFWKSNLICIHPSPHHTLHISIFHNAHFPPIFLILERKKIKKIFSSFPSSHYVLRMANAVCHGLTDYSGLPSVLEKIFVCAFYFYFLF